MSTFRNPLFTKLSDDAQETLREVGRNLLEAFDQQPSPADGFVKPYSVRFEPDADRTVLAELERVGIMKFFASPNEYLLTDFGKRAIVSCRDEFE